VTRCARPCPYGRQARPGLVGFCFVAPAAASGPLLLLPLVGRKEKAGLAATRRMTGLILLLLAAEPCASQPWPTRRSCWRRRA
jgi:hypothetical protein